jgi:hypothetical protein
MQVVLFAACAAVFAGGISTTCGSMYLGNLKIGQSYSLKRLLGFPYNATYKGAWLVTMNIYVEKPFKSTSDGFDPIPDAGWVSLERSTFALDPFQVAETDIRIDIPNDEQFLGKKYAVMIIPQTSAAAYAGGGVALGTALECILRLEIAGKPPTPEEIRQLKKQQMGQIMQTSITPERIFITEAPIGRNVDLKTEYGESLRIVNSTDFDCSITMEQLPADVIGVFPQAGYKVPEKQEWLKFGKKKFNISKNQIIEIPMSLNLPKDKVGKGEKLYFTTKVLVRSKIRETNYIVKVYVETESLPPENK